MLAAPVRRLGRLGQLHERDLADLHLRVDRHRQVRDIRQLERDVPVPAGVDEPGGRVDQEPEPPERALALEARDEVVGQADPLERRAEHELAGVQDERRPRPRPRRAPSGPPAPRARRCTGSGCCGKRGRSGRRGRRRSKAGAASRRTGRSRSGPLSRAAQSCGRRGPRGDSTAGSPLLVFHTLPHALRPPAGRSQRTLEAPAAGSAAAAAATAADRRADCSARADRGRRRSAA